MMATKTSTPPAQVPTDAAQRPPEPTEAELAMAQGGGPASATDAASELDRPTFGPPGAEESASASASAAAGWLANKRVLMVYQTTGAMDAWAYYDGGTGWRRSTQSNDVAARGVGLLLAAARTGGGIVHAYEGSSGVVDAVYLW